MSEVLPATEAIDPATADLDLLATGDLVAQLVSANARAVSAVSAAAASLARAVDACVATLAAGGTVYYVGAGTSGRLATLDAAELLPTFGLEPGRVRAIVAGGPDALVRAIEGAEDDRAAGERAMDEVRAGDTVVGISASGSAPFVIAAVVVARSRGAATVAIVNSAGSPLAAAVAIPIVCETGPEPLAGSTRMVAGTAAKIALNALSTATMVRLGKTYGNLMVDLVATNTKLRARAVRIVARAASADASHAAEALATSGGSVKTAIVMLRAAIDRATADARLARAGGIVRTALALDE